MKNLYFLLFIIIALDTSCRKGDCGDQTDENIYYNIPDSNKIQIPYHGNDTLIFVSEQGDTATLIGQGKKQYYEKQTSSIGYADCPKSKITNYENIEFSFFNTNLNNINNLKFMVYMPNNGGQPGLTYIDVFLNKNPLAISSFESLFYFKSKHDSILYENKFVSGYYFYDTLEKNVLYNLNYGILKIKDFESINWFLIKK